MSAHLRDITVEVDTGSMGVMVHSELPAERDEAGEGIRGERAGGNGELKKLKIVSQ